MNRHEMVRRLPAASMPAFRALTAIVRATKRCRRRCAERLGSARYSRPGLDGLDRKLAEHLPTHGVFLEAGANDGYRQSNTYFLERIQGWEGVLVEPVPALAELARRQRPRSQVVNAAIVGRDHAEDTISLRLAGLLSAVEGTKGWTDVHLGAGMDSPPGCVSVPAKTLNSILNECCVESVDFMSLDVEGHEEQALGGMDFDRTAPTFLLIEIWEAESRRSGIEEIIGSRYALVAQLTDRDYLYRRSPS